MDALDIMTNLDCVFPYFQPIFSADEHRVIGYEVLGRFKSSEGIISLGPFFLDRQIPEEYRNEVDQLVLTKALEKAITLDSDILLFINRDADLLMYDDAERFLDLLKQYEKAGVALNRIVIEIIDRHFSGDLEHLDHRLKFFRTYGIKIAIDKLGTEGSLLDRIGEIAPDILKVDLQALRSNNTGPEYQNILYSLSMLARKIGATLLFENIEMIHQLQFAWRNGGRYFQGFFLHEPSAEFVDRDLLKEPLKERFHQFIVTEKNKLEKQYSITEALHAKVQELLTKNRKFTQYEDLLMAMAKDMNQTAFRMYICDEDGFQKSPNIFKQNDEWVIQPEYSQKNWSWRPYFLENIIKMRNDRKGILSDLYCDIEMDETIRTFSFPLNGGDYLFIDLPYTLLFEVDGLL